MDKKEDKPVEPPMEIRQWISVEEGIEQALEANNVILMHYKIFGKETSVDELCSKVKQLKPSVMGLSLKDCSFTIDELCEKL